MLIEGKITPIKWKLLRERGLLTQEEELELAPLKKKPSAVYVWACRLIYELHRCVRHGGKVEHRHAGLVMVAIAEKRVKSVGSREPRAYQGCAAMVEHDGKHRSPLRLIPTYLTPCVPPVPTRDGQGRETLGHARDPPREPAEHLPRLDGEADRLPPDSAPDALL